MSLVNVSPGTYFVVCGLYKPLNEGEQEGGLLKRTQETANVFSFTAGFLLWVHTLIYQVLL